MISLSQLTAHTIEEIALPFMRGLHDDQQRPLISITIHFIFILLCFGIYDP